MKNCFTEKRAQAKRCCGPPGCGDQVHEDEIDPNAARLCMGSRCMAWRWALRLPNDPELYSDSVGYCGLAGKPE